MNGRPTAYMIVTPNPEPWYRVARGISRLNHPVSAVFVKFGDTRHGQNTQATELAVARRYGTTNPSLRVRVYPRTGPAGLPPNTQLGKFLEERVLRSLGFDRISHNVGTMLIWTEWYEIPLNTQSINDPRPFLRALVGLQTQFSSNNNQPPNAHQLSPFIDDCVRVFRQYSSPRPHSVPRTFLIDEPLDSEELFAAGAEDAPAEDIEEISEEMGEENPPADLKLEDNAEVEGLVAKLSELTPN